MAGRRQRDRKRRLRKPGMDREDVALLACRLLVAAFEPTNQRARRFNRDGTEAAYVAAQTALDLAC